MTSIPVSLPDAIRAKVEARAAAAGRADVADYIRALVEEDVAADIVQGAPHLSANVPERADALIREGLVSPVREMTTADWDEIRRRVEAGVARGGQG
jgi:hypothetical protein